MLTLAVAICLATVAALFPRTVYGVAGVALAIGAVVAASSWLALVVVVAIVALVAVTDGNGTAPCEPAYLLRSDVGVVVDAIPASAKATLIRFLPAVDDVVTVNPAGPVAAELEALLVSYSKAKASRHQTRAKAIWHRYCTLLNSQMGG